eukprot:1152842-Pelagomonas_calceolata.AAC.6
MWQTCGRVCTGACCQISCTASTSHAASHGFGLPANLRISNANLKHAMIQIMGGSCTAMIAALQS